MLACKARETVLRDQRFQVKKMENEEKKQSVQFEERQEDAKPHEDGRKEMDVKQTVVKHLEMRQRDVTKDVRKLKGMKSKNAASKKVFEDNFPMELAQIEQRRNAMLPRT